MQQAMEVDKDQFRKVVGHFATGVTVLTSRVGDNMHGMTANAVCSLSLDPLLVLVCVARKAESHDIVAQGGVFALNILSEGQEELSRQFVRKNSPEDHKFRDVPYRIGVTGCPLLEGCLAYLECRVVASYPGGDHTIFIGQVEAAHASGDGRPLIFYRSDYTGLKTWPLPQAQSL